MNLDQINIACDNLACKRMPNSKYIYIYIVRAVKTGSVVVVVITISFPFAQLIGLDLCAMTYSCQYKHTKTFSTQVQFM